MVTFAERGNQLAVIAHQEEIMLVAQALDDFVYQFLVVAKDQQMSPGAAEPPFHAFDLLAVEHLIHHEPGVDVCAQDDIAGEEERSDQDGEYADNGRAGESLIRIADRGERDPDEINTFHQ